MRRSGDRTLQQHGGQESAHSAAHCPRHHGCTLNIEHYLPMVLKKKEDGDRHILLFLKTVSEYWVV